MKKSSLLLLLVSLLLFSTLFSSCAQPAKSPDDTTAPAADVTTVPETSEEEALYADVPTGSYNGDTFKMMTNVSTWALTLMDAELSGDVIDDAVHNRNAAVEEKLGIDITVDANSNVLTAIRNQILTSDDTYDVFWDIASSTAQLAQEKNLIDLNEVPNLDLDKVWWYPTATASINLGKYTYMAASSIHLHFHESNYVIAFNKRLVQELQLESPYDLVDNNTWTLEKMHTMMVAAAGDVNGDGKYSTVDDKFGLCAHSNSGFSFIASSGYSIITLDENKLPVYNGLSEQFIDAYQKVLDYLYDSQLTASNKSDGASVSDYDAVFTEGRSLFMCEVVGALAEHRNDPDDFGIVVLPKFSETQEKYTSTIVQSAATMGIPVTQKNLDKTGVILENMAAESYRILTPAYYDVTLNYKYARDEKSIEMLDIIYENGRFEVANVYNWGSVRGTIESCLTGKITDISSVFKRMEKVINLAIQKTITAYEG